MTIHGGVNLEKFTALIVTECVKLLRKQPTKDHIIGGQHFKLIELGESIALILETFGVDDAVKN
jgi:hypothetical protein